MPWLLATFLNFNNLCESANELHFSPAVQLYGLSSMILNSFIILWHTWQVHDLFLLAFYNLFSFKYTEVFFRTFNCKFLNSNKHDLKLGKTVAYGRIYAWPLCGYIHEFWELWCALVLTTTPRKFSSVAQSCPTLCDPMNHSTPGLPVHHHLLEFTQTHVHWVSDAIQPSHPLSSPSPPAPNLS